MDEIGMFHGLRLSGQTKGNNAFMCQKRKNERNIGLQEIVKEPLSNKIFHSEKVLILLQTRTLITAIIFDILWERIFLLIEIKVSSVWMEE